jgi:hypothetical protein
MNYQLPRLTPTVKYLLIGYAAVFVLSIFIQAIPANLALFFQDTALGNISLVWRAFTYSFVTNLQGILGLMFFALFLWWVGGALESQWGTRTFVTFLAVTSAVAGLLSLLALSAFGNPIPVAGTVGLTFAIITVFAFLAPEAQFYMFGIFPLKAKWLVLISVILTFITPNLTYIIYALVVQIVSGFVAVAFVMIRFPLPYWLASALGKIRSDIRSRGSRRKSGKTRLSIYRHPDAGRNDGRNPDSIAADPKMNRKARKEVRKLMDRIYKSAKKEDENK